jgi:hypothetical protein
MDIERESSISNGEEGDAKANAAPELIRYPTSPVHEEFTSDIMVNNECLKLSHLPHWGEAYNSAITKSKCQQNSTLAKRISNSSLMSISVACIKLTPPGTNG